DRATLANMAPEYGATMGYFPVDERCCEYLASTGRPAEQVDAFRAYYQAQGLFGIPRPGQCDYSAIIEVDLAGIRPAVSGPKRPQDRVERGDLKARFAELLQRADAQGYNGAPEQSRKRYPVRMGASGAGGGEQDPDTLPDGRARNTSTL